MSCEIQEDAIRDLAYHNWQQAGCPECDGVQFWLEAEQEILSQKSSRSISDSSCSSSTVPQPSVKLTKAVSSLRKKAG